MKTKTANKVWEVAPGKCTADQDTSSDFSPKKSELACCIPWRSAVAMGDVNEKDPAWIRFSLNSAHPVLNAKGGQCTDFRATKSESLLSRPFVTSSSTGDTTPSHFDKTTSTSSHRRLQSSKLFESPGGSNLPHEPHWVQRQLLGPASLEQACHPSLQMIQRL